MSCGRHSTGHDDRRSFLFCRRTVGLGCVGVRCTTLFIFYKTCCSQRAQQLQYSGVRQMSKPRQVSKICLSSSPFAPLLSPVATIFKSPDMPSILPLHIIHISFSMLSEGNGCSAAFSLLTGGWNRVRVKNVSLFSHYFQLCAFPSYAFQPKSVQILCTWRI